MTWMEPGKATDKGGKCRQHFPPLFRYWVENDIFSIFAAKTRYPTLKNQLIE